jgi:hypothetical protein
VELDADHFDYFEVTITNPNVAVNLAWHSLAGLSSQLPAGRKVKVVVIQAAAGAVLNNSSFAVGSCTLVWQLPYTGPPPLQGISGAYDVYDFTVTEAGFVLGTVTRY